MVHKPKSKIQITGLVPVASSLVDFKTDEIFQDVSPCEQTGLQCWEMMEETNLREQDRGGQPDCDCK